MLLITGVWGGVVGVQDLESIAIATLLENMFCSLVSVVPTHSSYDCLFRLVVSSLKHIAVLTGGLDLESIATQAEDIFGGR